MPSTSGSSETSGGTDVETADSEDGPRLRVTASVDSASDRPPGYHHRVRVAALAAEREALDEQVDELRAEMEALEAEVEALERTVASRTGRSPTASPSRSPRRGRSRRGGDRWPRSRPGSNG